MLTNNVDDFKHFDLVIENWTQSSQRNTVMHHIEHIKKLYQLDNPKGLSLADIDTTQKRLGLSLPKILVEYHQVLGLEQVLNHTHNDILGIDEIDFVGDYLIIAKENQEVCHWAIKKGDLHQDNPSVYACYHIEDKNPNWYLENKTLSDFLLMMALFNATMGGIKYHANYLKDNKIDDAVVQYIKTHWQEIKNIQENDKTCYFTQDFNDVLILCFDDNQACNGVFVASNEPLKFDKILDLDIDWSYVSDEDDEFDEDDGW